MISLALAFLSIACNRDSPTRPENATGLPARFLLLATASGADSEGTTAECSLDLIFELTEVQRTTQWVEYTGFHGGGAARTVLAPDGSGFAFFADVHGEAEARLLFPDRVELLIPANVDAESRFWRHLSRFEGTVTQFGRGNGNWICAPFDMDVTGYLDSSVMADGTWQFEAQP